MTTAHAGWVPFKDYQPAPGPSHTTTNPGAERDLVAALRRRDETAYRVMVRRYTPLMLRLARPHVPSQAIAEDVVQDTWMAVLLGIDAFQSRSRFTTWLMRILLNTARKRGVREHTPVRWDALGAEPLSTEPLPASQASPEATALSAEVRVVLRRRSGCCPIGSAPCWCCATSRDGPPRRCVPSSTSRPTTNGCCCTGRGRRSGRRWARASTTWASPISPRPERPACATGPVG